MGLDLDLVERADFVLPQNTSKITVNVVFLCRFEGFKKPIRWAKVCSFWRVEVQQKYEHCAPSFPPWHIVRVLREPLALARNLKNH